ncbi:uncharacterized protein LODBEIA_P53250 [Lodderomyces beijingensis]|uniref:PHD-type domain-containing protein n=1 Tax=Lodderomyces beijingensis TaxID=1775926 RepID=A0ABP0ZVF0_9ASCO
MPEIEIRRSSRSNKGVHSHREKVEEEEEEDVYQRLKAKKTQKKEEGTGTSKAKAEAKAKEDSDNNDNNDVEEEEEEFVDSDDGEIRCGPCGTTTENYDADSDPHGDMVQCEKCNTWQHIKCMGLKKTSLAEKYECDVCSGSPRLALKRKRPTPTSTERVKKSQKVQQESAEAIALVEKVVNPIEALKNPTRVSTAKAFYNFFKKSYPSANGAEIGEEEKTKKATDLALEIEDIIQREYPGKAYVGEGRRILFVLKKQFTDEIFAGTLTLEDLVKKTPEEINQDIKRIEEQNKQNIRNIVLKENDQTQIVRRTHKGDVIKENENEEYYQMDESIGARAVDHRRFSEGGASPAQVVLSTPGEQSAYNNTNPRLESDDEHSDLGDGHEQQPREANRVYSNNNKAKEKEEKEQEKNGDNDDYNNDYNNNGKYGDDHEDNAVRSTESLSDVDQRRSPDAQSLHAILAGNATGASTGTGAVTGAGYTDQSKFEPVDVWHGSMTFPDYAHFKAVGKFYSSTDDKEHFDFSRATAKDIMKDHKYTIRGRLERSRCDKYLEQVISTRNLYFVQIQPEEEKEGDDDEVVSGLDSSNYARNYDRLCNYFIKENKVGVLSGKPEFVKDSYIMPIDFRDAHLGTVIKSHKRDLRIGLFAVFVVSKGYTPVGMISRSYPKSSVPASLPAVPSSLPPIPLSSSNNGSGGYYGDSNHMEESDNLKSLLNQLK